MGGTLTLHWGQSCNFFFTFTGTEKNYQTEQNWTRKLQWLSQWKNRNKQKNLNATALCRLNNGKLLRTFVLLWYNWQAACADQPGPSKRTEAFKILPLVLPDSTMSTHRAISVSTKQNKWLAIFVSDKIATTKRSYQYHAKRNVTVSILFISLGLICAFLLKDTQKAEWRINI